MDRLREANPCVGTHRILLRRTVNLHRGGVAVIVTRKVEQTVLEWKPVNYILMKVIFNSKFAKLTIIAFYAPSEEAEEEKRMNYMNN